MRSKQAKQWEKWQDTVKTSGERAAEGFKNVGVKKLEEHFLTQCAEKIWMDNGYHLEEWLIQTAFSPHNEKCTEKGMNGILEGGHLLLMSVRLHLRYLKE